MHDFTLESCIILHFLHVNLSGVNRAPALGACVVSNVARCVERGAWFAPRVARGLGHGSRTGGSRCAFAGALFVVRGYRPRVADSNYSLDGGAGAVTVKASITERIVT